MTTLLSRSRGRPRSPVASGLRRLDAVAEHRPFDRRAVGRVEPAFGGAGGFGAGVIEALDDEGVAVLERPLVFGEVAAVLGEEVLHPGGVLCVRRVVAG